MQSNSSWLVPLMLSIIVLAGTTSCKDVESSNQPMGPNSRGPSPESITVTPEIATNVATNPTHPTATVSGSDRLGLKVTPNPKGLQLGSHIGGLAPDFRLESDEGELVVLSEFRGKPIFLNFFAVWCGPCRFEMPAIENIHNVLGEQLTVIAIDIREAPDMVTAYKDILNLTFLTVMDRHRHVANGYQVPVLPWSFIIDEQGIVRDIKAGAFLNDGQIMEALEKAGVVGSLTSN